MNLRDIRERLLDLGKTNRLIQFHDSKKTSIDLIHPSPDHIFLQLTKGKSWEIFDIDSLRIELEKKEKELTLLEEDVIKVDLISEAKKRMRSHQILLHKKDLSTRPVIKEIAKKAKEGLSEKGINTLYAAFGFIKWRESEASKDLLSSPLLIVPISISMDSQGAFQLSTYEDEVILNPALTYKLRSDFNIQLPEYDEEVDKDSLSAYFSRVRDALVHTDWTLTENAKLGFFSFTKMNMYYDLLDHEQEVLESDLVQAILDASKAKAYDPDELNVNPKSLDVTINAVVNADSSQLEAIQLSKRNISFVLQGPPGTGKSQTITNIIAEAIMDGKSVLFVSEKIAALKVVHSNLKKVHLDPFCLELHSHKANKREVIDEVYRTLMAEKTAVRETVSIDIEALKQNKKELDEYDEALHQKHHMLDMTPFQIYSVLAKLEEILLPVYLIPDIRQKSIQHLRDTMELLNRFAQTAKSISSDYRTFPLFGIQNEMNYEERRLFESALDRLLTGLTTAASLISELSSSFGNAIQSIQHYRDHSKFIAFLIQAKWVCADVLTKSAVIPFKAMVLKELKLREAFHRYQTEIDKRYRNAIYDLPAKDLLQTMTREYKSIFRLLNPAYRALIQNMKNCQLEPKRGLSYKDAVNTLKTLDTHFENRQTRMEIESQIRERYPKSRLNDDDDYRALNEEVLLWIDYGNKGFIPESLRTRNQEEFAVLQSHLQTIVERFEIFEKTHSEDISRVQRLVAIDQLNLIGWDIQKVLQKTTSMHAVKGQLENWTQLLRVLKPIKSKPIDGFLTECLDKKIPLEQISLAYQKGYFVQWIHSILDSVPALSRFSRINHDLVVNAFQKHDNLRFEIVKAQIHAKLSALRPNPDLIATGSQASIIRTEYAKKRKNLSVRQLLTKTFDLMRRIKPCFLMSPLSVSTYLDAESIRFDLVIFDEASQIFPQDALGAIYRGKQVIVVGDTKQMPPSNFFAAGTTDADMDIEDGEETAGDYESILDISNTRFPQKRLKWHYRSKIEDLIAFSNWNYYDNQLVTFPSFLKHAPGFGVELHYVPDGIFNRESKSNLKEAEHIAKLIVDEIKKHPDRSLGVVAFSITQQEVIEEYLDKMMETDPSIASLYDDKKEEPFFVKNLETVQGDERDTIIMSIAYGKDLAGKFHHNFGPLNRVGGERRLNVAVTRAKYNVIVVSSITSSDIDLSKTSALGVKHLKTYLEYAEKGPLALYSQVTGTGSGQTDSEFEEQVKRVIEHAGYQVDTQIGCSGFRIDLGVKHPTKGDYFIAIECDGATYHSGRNTRDRDRLRQEILERLGWSFYRIWSTDWFRNRENAERQLLEEIETQLIAFDSKLDVNEPTIQPATVSSISQPILTIVKQHYEFPPYRISDTQAIFRKYANKRDTIAEIIMNEAPIHTDYLLRRVAWMYGREKVTSVVRELFANEGYFLLSKGFVLRNGFYYSKPMITVSLRVPRVEDIPREISEIAIEELAGGMVELIKQNGGIQKEGMFQALAQTLGFKRVGPNIWDRLEECLEYLMARKIVSTTESGTVILDENGMD